MVLQDRVKLSDALEMRSSALGLSNDAVRVRTCRVGVEEPSEATAFSGAVVLAGLEGGFVGRWSCGIPAGPWRWVSSVWVQRATMMRRYLIFLRLGRCKRPSALNRAGLMLPAEGQSRMAVVNWDGWDCRRGAVGCVFTIVSSSLCGCR